MSFSYGIDLEGTKVWLDIISGFGILIAGILTAFWAYTKYILERGFLPPTQLDVDCKTIGTQADRILVEITVRIKNLGTSALIVKNLKVDHIRYLEHTDKIESFTILDALKDIQKNKPKIMEQLKKPEKQRRKRNLIIEKAAKIGRLNFPKSISKDLRLDKIAFNESYLNIPHKRKQGPFHRTGVNKVNERYPSSSDFFRILGYDTFVQPKVEQIYTFITSLPISATFLLVKCSFVYGQYPSKSQRLIIKITRKLGLIQYSLIHATVPHTIERIFGLAPTSR